ncbi:threonine/serine ThrE exporter family protein [Campylobacter pinnipediorum]|uniref:Threonine/serine exporter-like N-terminal domain-containing protein n=1 Tax=Campylobacter pinnipediorum subsp. pinnipediorum TaxID=1660067 RepID=A0AAX0LAI9_9BACT|nr:threonine/serine exporter family protein [Campylobacter pinnipediorum]AQW82665.1 hypothetical membrane protein (DUF1212 domain) [Campylobacter pinnipediorum subsp. pinnipediorum]AQW84352.1 hypothetical membrane protein (DUF1212 domain) [Campylobacter pinnipediorum subsp. pinnipediorum]OPA77161.1 hypothetical protein BFG05_04400 [Campylobacter pinnipediorum subsp. pinnipediorum]OPA78947.1 hypothetical protein BFG04_02690 [Campylobacter pinnipediorum subsp. pinnipediorum]
MNKPNIEEVAKFLVEYTSKMLSIGTYTARVDRCVSRVAKSYGYNVSLTALTKHFSISITDNSNSSNFRTYVIDTPNHFISFRLISELSALSWQIQDECLSIQDAIQNYNEIINFKQNHIKKTILFISLANAAFCKLFGGDIGSMFVVFVSTFIGFIFRHLTTKIRLNIKLQHLMAAFISSFVAYLGIYFGFSATPDIAIGSSVLYLMPGVMLINSTFDILNSNVLIGLAKAMNTGLLIVCIAIGIYITLSISSIKLLNV